MCDLFSPSLWGGVLVSLVNSWELEKDGDEMSLSPEVPERHAGAEG